MIPNPIVKVLSTLSCHEVRHLLMGGQACVFYGAAEFSRDCDVVVLAENENLARLESALAELQAKRIAFPEFKPEHLARGHAVHFRCYHSDAHEIRLDVMTKMRGCDEFDALWYRRTTIEDPNAGISYELLSIEDLVRAKKTQRDKDWPMIRRLVEAHHQQFRAEASDKRIRFWLRECRTPDLLSQIAKENKEIIVAVGEHRPWLTQIDMNDLDKIQQALDDEQAKERELDEAYWRPLKAELEQMRMNRSKE